MNSIKQFQSGHELRREIRSNRFTGHTAGQAPNHLQGNVVILPLRYAPDFLQFCLNNPKPCPLIGLTEPGNPMVNDLGDNVDIRTDVSRYKIYQNGSLSHDTEDISGLWADDFVTFILGCSFTFEDALIKAGFSVRHIEQGLNAPMFKTNIETMRAGVFTGPLVVSMRPYKRCDVPAIFDLCAHYPHAHGTPIYWGDPELIGIDDLAAPDYGDAVTVEPDEVPVFWACGVTPQAVIEAAKPELCITHAPGHMLVSDIASDKIPGTLTGMKNFH